MLDISAEAVSFVAGPGFRLEVSANFRRSSHTALVGPGGSGKTTLLRLLSGQARPSDGRIRVGTRETARLKPSRLPILAFPRDVQLPARWSVQHALVAAARRRTLDREDRLHEIEFTAEKWRLVPLIDRQIKTLSTTERLHVWLAVIEISKPAVFVAERLFASATATQALPLAEELYRTLRANGTTVINEPTHLFELGFCDRVMVMDSGRIVQEGTSKDVYDHPRSSVAAASTGEANLLPVTPQGSEVDSPIGRWVDRTGLEGAGTAIARPSHFRQVASGEESDLILGVEEAGFYDGAWHVRGFITGGGVLRVALSPAQSLHKGRLIPLAYDPERFTLLAAPPGQAPASSGVIPSLGETR